MPSEVPKKKLPEDDPKDPDSATDTEVNWPGGGPYAFEYKGNPTPPNPAPDDSIFD